MKINNINKVNDSLYKQKNKCERDNSFALCLKDELEKQIKNGGDNKACYPFTILRSLNTIGWL